MLPPSRESRAEALDDLLRQQQLMAERLVLSEEIPLAELKGAVAEITSAIRQHARLAESYEKASTRGFNEVRVGLARDHQLFPQSAVQLQWHLDIVLRDNHGGNRQALGQYWKILLEALGKHRREELHLLGSGPSERVV